MTPLASTPSSRASATPTTRCRTGAVLAAHGRPHGWLARTSRTTRCRRDPVRVDVNEAVTAASRALVAKVTSDERRS